MEKPSSNIQVAISSLVGTMFTLAIAVAVGLARIAGIPTIDVAVNGTILTVAFFALPLLWWRHKVGYAVSIAVGLVNVIGNSFALIPGNLAAFGIPTEFALVIVAQTILSVILIVSSYRASREKA